MILDIETPFGQIHPDASTFTAQLHRMTPLTSNTTTISAWPRTLRLITPHPDDRTETETLRPEKVQRTNQTIIFDDNPGQSYPSQRIIPPTVEPCKCNAWSRNVVNEAARNLWITAKEDAPDCSHFVAVSYCWPQPDDANLVLRGSYNLFSVRGQKVNDAPDEVIARALAYANHRDLSAIWIDQECIDQQDASDKEAGIQSMHLVYESAQCSVGLLSIFIEEQIVLDMLAAGNLQEFPFHKREALEALIRFLRIFDAERWFTRAWCMQESWSAGQRMELLIRHDRKLQKHPRLGDMDGEVLLPFQQLSSILKFLVLMVKSCSQFFPDFELDEAWLDQFARKTAASPTPSDNGTGIELGKANRFRCSAAQALHALAPRENSRIVDRIAIFANLCDYGIRLDTRRLEDDGIAFSTAAFALAILNGDLTLMDCQPGNSPASVEWLMRSLNLSQNTTLGATATEHIRSRLAFSWGPPLDGIVANPAWVPEGLHPRRLTSCKLSDEGLETSGYIFGSDIILAVSSVKDEHQAEWDALTKATDGERSQTAVDKVHIKIIWSLVRLLVRAKFLALAQVIWMHENDLCIVGEGEKDAFDVPRDLAQLLDPTTDAFIFQRPASSAPVSNNEPEGTAATASSSTSLTEQSFVAGLQPTTPRPPDTADVNRTWLSRTVMTAGKLHCGRQLSTGPILPAPSFISYGVRSASSTPEESDRHKDGHQDHHRQNPMNLRPGVVPPSLLPLTQPPAATAPASSTAPPGSVPREAYTAVFEHAPADGPSQAFIPSVSVRADPVRSPQTWRPLFFVAKKLFRTMGPDGTFVEAGEAWKVMGADRMTRGYVIASGIGSRCVLA